MWWFHHQGLTSLQALGHHKPRYQPHLCGPGGAAEVLANIDAFQAADRRKGSKGMCFHPSTGTFYMFHTKTPLVSSCQRAWEMVTGQQAAHVKIKVLSLKKIMTIGLANSICCHQVQEN